MSNWPLLAGGNVNARASLGAFTATGAPIINSHGSSANSLGAWGEVTASAPFDVDGISISISPNTTGTVWWLLNVGVGAASSEQIVATGIPYFQEWSDRPHGHVFVPVRIARGQRIAIQARCSSASSLALATYVQLYAAGPRGFGFPSEVIAIGADSTTTKGTPVTTHATADTKGNWAELTSSTPRPIRGIIICATPSASNPPINAWRLDIGVGAASSEVVLVPDFQLQTDVTGDYVMPAYSHLIPVNIPAETRISARLRRQSGGALALNISLLAV
jgi:hypothetical protein